jgi:hypothetical protein
MGFNTAVIILNDHLGYIRDDAEFGRKVYDACTEMWISRRVDRNSFKVVAVAHSGDGAVIFMRGNTGWELDGYAKDGRCPDDEAVEALTRAADSYGYELVKKGKR